MNMGMSYKDAVIGMAAGMIIMGSSMAHASSVTVPNTFSTGTPAVASDVNGNFSAVAAGVNDNDGRITTNETNIGINASGVAGNTTAISTNASDIAALEARVAALEGSSGLTIASVNGTYKMFSLDNGTGFHQQDDGNGVYAAADDDVDTELLSVTFDGSGNFSGVIDQGAQLVRVTNQSGEPSYTLADISGTTLGGTYTVSGSVITMAFTNPDVFTMTAYATADGSVFIMHGNQADGGIGWGFYTTVIRVGVKLAP